MSWLHILQVLAALIVLVEALNKLHRTDLFDGRRGVLTVLAGSLWLLRPWAWRRARVVVVLKTLGWACLSLGAFGSMQSPPTGAHVAVLVGFALLIVRTRLKEICQ